MSIRAVAYLSNIEFFPFSFRTNKCKSLLQFESGRAQSGLTIRPILCNVQATYLVMQSLHSSGRNTRGDGSQLVNSVAIPLNAPTLVVRQVDDSDFQLRIDSYLKARYRNCHLRERNRRIHDSDLED